MFYFTTRLYFWNECQTTLQVQAYISRLRVEIYVQLRCYCCVRILGQLSGRISVKLRSGVAVRILGNIGALQNIDFAMETMAKKLNCLSSY